MATIYGLPACSCLVEWLPKYSAELRRQGLSSIRWTRLAFRAGGNSGSTHWPGGGADGMLASTADYSKAVKIARNMGAAAWHRTPAQGFAHHLHLVLKGCPHNDGGRYQIGALEAGYNGLGAGGKGGRDDGARVGVKFPLRSYRDGIKYAADLAKPPAPEVIIKPWFNVSFLNTWGNSVEGGRNFASRVTAMAETSAHGSPALAAFCEVRDSQYGLLDKAMKVHGYERVANTRSNMIVVYARPHVDVIGFSFAKFSQQDGGNVEGVLRVKFRIDGSRAQLGVLHLDHDSSEGKKRSNLTEAYKALKRYGIATLLPDWKSRTVIIGDINDTDVAGKVLGPLGFKTLLISGIDQSFVGSKRVTRGGDASKTKSDHPRILVRIGRR